MNVIFHTTSAIGIAALLTDTHKISNTSNTKTTFKTSVFAFLMGIILHGLLDYIPHCYPINSKLDVIFSSGIILLMTWSVNKQNRQIVGMSFIGSIFPDIVDLLPKILNNKLGSLLPVFDNVFPWHWHIYSGSIYNQECTISTLNHILLLLIVGFICWYKRIKVMRMFGKT